MKYELINFETIYTTYYNDGYTFSLWLCKNKDEAKDITSETFIRMWTAKTSIDYSTIKSYLFKISRNLYFHQIRSKRLFVDVNEVELSSTDIVNSNIESDYLLEKIDSFEEPDSTIFLMKIHQELSYQEISEIVEISINSCKVKIFRMRKKLIQFSQKEEK